MKKFVKICWVPAVCLLFLAAYAAGLILSDSYIQKETLSTLLVLMSAMFMVFAMWFCRHRAKRVQWFSFALGLTLLLTWTYFSNPLDGENTMYAQFQCDSDSLVYSAIKADREGLLDGHWYLGNYATIIGNEYILNGMSHNFPPITDEEEGIVQGYTSDFPGIAVAENAYGKAYLVPGNYVEFSNKEVYEIVSVTTEDNIRYVCFNGNECLTVESMGELDRAKVLSSAGEELSKAQFGEYSSQYGLQGKLMVWIARLIPVSPYALLPLLCSFAFSTAVVVYAFLLFRKYNLLAACSFFVVFWFSPWVVCFAKSVYWVEFTWLIPAIFGLLLSLCRENRMACCICYVGVLLSVFVKSLCGYEYITFVMIGAVLPLLIDFADGLQKRNMQDVYQAFRMIVLTGVFALFGFGLAMLFHADLIGSGDIMVGLESIKTNAMIRTVNDTVLGEVVDTRFSGILAKYMTFSTHIVLGVNGSYFKVLVLAPLLLFVWNYIIKGKQHWGAVMAYVVALFGSVAWFFLARQHSYVHTHMNYICWYYYLIPVCVYLILTQFHAHVLQRAKNEE